MSRIEKFQTEFNLPENSNLIFAFPAMTLRLNQSVEHMDSPTASEAQLGVKRISSQHLRAVGTE